MAVSSVREEAWEGHMHGSGPVVPTLGTGDRGEESAGGLATPRGHVTAREPFTLQASVRSRVKGVTTAPLAGQ